MLGKIYIIQSPNTDKVYIGSTFRTLQERFGEHKKPNNETSSYLIIDEGDAFIELLEEVKVIDDPELCFYENQYLELYRDVAVNKKFAFGEDKEQKAKRDKNYRDRNKNKILERSKNYRETHKDKCLEIDKKYREKVKYKVECPCGSVIGKREMSRHIKSQKHQKYLENVAQE